MISMDEVGSPRAAPPVTAMVPQHWPIFAPYVATPDALAATQVCRAWHVAAEATALWSAPAVARASNVVDACEARAAVVAARDAERLRGAPRAKKRTPMLFGLEKRPAFVNFVYGEIGPQALARVLGACGSARGGTFADLGSGAGRTLAAAAALAAPARVVGVELLDGYDAAARATLAHLPAVLASEDAPAVDLRHGSFTDGPDVAAWTGADLVVATTTCFDAEQMDRIAAHAASLRRGAYLVTLDKPLPDAAGNFELRHRVACPACSWGPALAYVHRRR